MALMATILFEVTSASPNPNWTNNATMRSELWYNLVLSCHGKSPLQQYLELPQN